MKRKPGPGNEEQLRRAERARELLIPLAVMPGPIRDILTGSVPLTAPMAAQAFAQKYQGAWAWRQSSRVHLWWFRWDEGPWQRDRNHTVDRAMSRLVDGLWDMSQRNKAHFSFDRWALAHAGRVPQLEWAQRHDVDRAKRNRAKR